MEQAVNVMSLPHDFVYRRNNPLNFIKEKYMTKFGKTALDAYCLLINNKEPEPVLDPETAWKRSADENLSHSEAMQKKTCPKNTFIGLCDAGLLKDITGENTCTSVQKKYAKRAVELLRGNEQLKENKTELWRQVLKSLGCNIDKHHDSQMDVVVSFFNKGLINDTCQEERA
jgi:hypothetical protein